MDVVSLAILGAVAVGAGAVWLPRYLRTRNALSEEIGTDQCVACQSTAVTEFAPECYRCDGCRFEWGDGLKVLAADKRRAQISAMSHEDKRAFALSELREAAAHVQAAEAALEHAGNQLAKDLLIGGGGRDMYSQSRNEGMVTAAREMGLAQKNIQNADDATDGVIESDGGEIKVNTALFGIDVWLDSTATVIAGHAQVGKLQTQARGMRDSIARAVKALEKPETPQAYR